MDNTTHATATPGEPKVTVTETPLSIGGTPYKEVTTTTTTEATTPAPESAPASATPADSAA